MAEPKPDLVAVLIPASGKGSRLGGRRKQFRRLGGEPLIVRTMRAFQEHDAIDCIVVAAPADARSALEVELRRCGISKLVAVVCGGASRQASVHAALCVVPPEITTILVHDAVRPFVEPGHIDAVIAGVQCCGAAALGVPVSDTLRYADRGVYGETVPRAGLYRMQTPQGFRRDWFEEAHTAAEKQKLRASDDVELVRKMGHPVEIIAGSSLNVKITTPDDWEIAQLVWSYFLAHRSV